MMAELSELYQEVILDHNKAPRNFKELSAPTATSHGHNPLCGDDYHLALNLDEAGVIQDIGFIGSGCAISKASASMMTAVLKKKTAAEAMELLQQFTILLTAGVVPAETRGAVGRLAIFEGVKSFPVRVKCAMLIWRTLEDALQSLGDRPLRGLSPVSTEDPLHT